MRSPAKIYRLIKRKNSRYIAVRLKNGKQRSSKEIDREAARAFAYRWLATSFPDLAKEVGIATTPSLTGLKASNA